MATPRNIKKNLANKCFVLSISGLPIILPFLFCFDYTSQTHIKSKVKMNFLTFLKKVILAVPLACYTFYYFSLSLVEVYHLLVLFINQVLLNNFNFGCFYALSLFGILYHQPVIVSLFAIVQLLSTIALIIWYLLFRVKNGQIEHDNSGGGDNDFQQILVSVVLSLVAVLFVKDLKERQPQTRRLN